MKILILGGTGEARQLAGELVKRRHKVITSLVGRTTDPMLPEGDIRVGKFGGVPGLLAYIKAHDIGQVVDATHPYAGLISVNAVAAAEKAGVPLLRLMRAPWAEQPGANWTHVPDVAAAAQALPSGAKVLLTTGHGGLDEFFRRDDCLFTVRLIDPPELSLPGHAHLLLDRPPYSLQSERHLMQREIISHLVSKNSGGGRTSAKLEAARQLGVGIIMIDRPSYGPAREVDTVEAALEALRR